jgi:hypothetical protein
MSYPQLDWKHQEWQGGHPLPLRAGKQPGEGDSPSSTDTYSKERISKARIHGGFTFLPTGFYADDSLTMQLS